MTVNPILTASVLIGTSSNPVCSGTLVTFNATTINGGPSPAYQWKVNGLNAGTNSPFYSYTPVNGDVVTCIMTSNASCITGSPAMSNSITMTVDANLPVSVSVAASSNPTCAGTSVTFTATPTNGGTSPVYQWHKNGIVAGTNSPTYTFVPVSNDKVYVVMTSNLTCATGNPATSNTITMTVNPNLPVSVVNSVSLNPVCAGTSVTFTAAPVNGGISPTYQWYKNGIATGTNSPIFAYIPLEGDQVYVVVNSSLTCTSGNPASSNTLTMTVNPNLPVSVSVSPSSNPVCAGTAVVFSAIGINGGPSPAYQWKVNGNNAGANSSTYNYIPSNNDIITCVLTSDANCSTGSPAASAGLTMTVDPLLTAGVSIAASPSGAICSGTPVTFTATPTNGGISPTYQWKNNSVNVGTNSPTFTTSTLVNGDKITCIMTSNAICASGSPVTSSVITNIVNAVPVANAGAGGNVCNLNFTFSAIPSIGVGTWTKISGPGTVTFSPGPNNANATATVSDYGTYTFTWTENNLGCQSSSTITINFYQQPLANAGSGGNNCGLVFGLNAIPSAGTGTWTKTQGPGTATFSPGAGSPDASVTVSAFGSYKFTWTEVNGGCSSGASINVSFIQSPPANAGTGGHVCGLSFVLNAVPGTGTGTWTKTSGPGGAVFSPDSNNPGAVVTVDQYGVYVFAWTEVNITCLSVGYVTVTFNQPPFVSAGRDTSICKGKSLRLQGSGTGSYHWTPENLVSDTIIADPVVSPASQTTFKLAVTDLNGCSNSDSVIVDVLSMPVADAGNDQTLDYTFNTQISATELKPGENGIWSIIYGSGIIADSISANTTLSGLAIGKNVFLWSVSNNTCQPVHSMLTITVNELLIPSLITPNMDGKNDYFVLKGIESLGRTELKIFDRWGVQVYSNSNYNNDWNGVSMDGSPLPDDTYFYVLKAQNGISKSGYIVIRR